MHDNIYLNKASNNLKEGGNMDERRHEKSRFKKSYNKQVFPPVILNHSAIPFRPFSGEGDSGLPRHQHAPLRNYNPDIENIEGSPDHLHRGNMRGRHRDLP